MKLCFRIVLTVVLALIANALAIAQTPQDGETVRYRVMYKWGIVNKQAGHVTITTRPTAANTRFESTLVAHSEPWADRFYMVRDTLLGVIDAVTYEPQSYRKITREGGKYKLDHIAYTRSGNTTSALCSRTRQNKDSGALETSRISLQANGLTLDMLSAFYYMRSLDFPRMNPGDKKVLTVFSGKRKETLTITYHGRTTVDVDKNHFPAYHITFRFTGDNGKTTSDNLDAWIATDESRVPLKLEGKLPVGKVQCFYIPNN